MFNQDHKNPLWLDDKLGSGFLPAETPVPAPDAENAPYRLLVENAAPVIWLLDVDRRFSFVSPAVKSLRGFSQAEAMQQSLAQTVTPASYAILSAELDRIYQAEAAGVPYTPAHDRFEVEQFCRDGTTVWTELTLNAAREAGKFVGVVGVALDISYRKQAKPALSAYDQQYHQMFYQHSAAKLIIDPKTGQIVEANPAACAFYGYTASQLCQMNMADLDSLPFSQLYHKLQLAQKRQRDYFQFQHRAASGQLHDVEMYIVPVWFKDKELLYSIVHDITEQRRAQFDIQKSNAELQQRLNELALLNELSESLTSTLDVDAILNTVTLRLVRLFEADTCGVTLLNAEKTALTVVAEYNRHNIDSAIGLVLSLADNPLSVQVIESRQPALQVAHGIAEFTTVPQELLDHRRVHCLLVAPLIHRAEVIGTLGLDTSIPGRVFNEAEMALAQTIAGQIAGAITNARLFQQERRQRQIAESQQAVAMVLNSSLDLPTVLKKILDQFSHVLHHDGAAVFLLDNEDLVITTGTGLGELHVGSRISIFSENPAARVYRSHTPLIIPDVDLDPDWDKWPDSVPIRSWMGVPLAVNGRVLGVLSADSFRAEAYTAVDEQVFSTFANHAATAIRNALQLNTIEETMREAQLLYRVASILAKTPDTQHGAEKALGELLQALGAKQGGLSLFDLKKQIGYLYVLYRDGQPQPIGAGINIKSRANQYIIDTKRSLAVYDVYNEPLLLDNRDITLAHNIKSMLLTPLISRGEVIGTMGVDSTENYRHFSEREQNLAQAIADAIAVTLENTRLFQQEQHQRQVAQSLNEVAAILNSNLDYRDVLRKILEQLGRVVSYDGTGILLQQGEQLVLAAGTELAGAFIGATISLATDDPAVRVLKNNRALVIDDVHQDPGWEIWPDGDVICGWLGVPLRNSKGVIGVLSVDSHTVGQYDETDARLLQLFANQAAIAIENANLFKEYQLAKEAAEAASQAKSVFLASISHELRTPLNGILGFAQILKMDPQLTPGQSEGVDIIEQSGTHLLNLINDILDLAKVEAGKLELNYAEFNLTELLMGVCKSMRIRAEFKNIDFQCDHSSNDTLFRLPVVVSGDEFRLRQVLINLLGNAIKFTNQGVIHFRSRRVDDGRDPARCTIRFEVEDSGSGIDPAELSRIFEPFYQAGDKKRRAEGTGLGLAICYNLVAMMGGQLQVNSVVGQGSLFWFEIPMPEAVGAAPALVLDVGQIVGIKGWRPKILVISSSLENRKVLEGMLRPLGCSIREAADGQEGLDKALAYQPDAIITDLHMPRLSGIELTTRLRQMSQFEATVIIINSGSGLEADRDQSLAAGCQAFLARPVRLASLLYELEQYLGLEWIYAGAEANALPELVPPPASQLAQLVELARIGDIRQIKRDIENLETQQPQYREFVRQVNVLLKGFHVDKLRSFLESF